MRKAFQPFGAASAPRRQGALLGIGLFETATLLHGLLYRWRMAGAQRAFSSPINAMNRAVMMQAT
jgi:hypothetical protein